jgi:hypothetical protein
MLAHTLSRATPSALLQESCPFIYFAPIEHTSFFDPLAVGCSCWRSYLLSREENCIGDRRRYFRPLVAARPPFVASPG